MTSVTVENLRVAYGDNVVLQDLDLEIRDGEFFTLLGPSGCGKTTLLRTIAGFIQSSAGRVLFDERDMTNVPTHRRNIGMMFQDYALFPNKTVAANVAYGLKARKVRRPEIMPRVVEALERVSMESFADRHIGALSGGQRQRVALARALVIRPSMLLMDEPLSALDTKLRVQIRESITDLQRELGITTVFVTHDQEEALAMSHRIALFKEGRIEQMGSPMEMYRHPRSSYAADFIGAANVLPVDVSRADAEAPGDEITVTLHGAVLRGTRQSELQAGGAFAIARPEHLRVTRVPQDDECRSTTSLTGEVLRQQYLGRMRHYNVRLAEGIVVEASEPAVGTGFESGELVHVNFPSHETLVVAS